MLGIGRLVKWLSRGGTSAADADHAPAEEAPGHDESAGAAYGELIEVELREESARRTSIDGRAQTVITSIGVLVGLAVTIAPLVGYRLPIAAVTAVPPLSDAEATVCVPTWGVLFRESGDICMRVPGAVAFALELLMTVPELALLALGAIALLLAVLFALYAMAPTVYEVAAMDALERLTREEFWVGPRPLGARRTAEVRALELRAARNANGRKVKRLTAALVLEVVGIFCLAVVAFSAVWSAATRA